MFSNSQNITRGASLSWYIKFALRSFKQIICEIQALYCRAQWIFVIIVICIVELSGYFVDMNDFCHCCDSRV